MKEWELRTRDRQWGMISCKGVRGEDGMITFTHPHGDGEEIVLRISEDRAEEIASWSPHRQAGLNLRIVAREVYIGRDSHYEPLKRFPCPHCGMECTWIDSDLIIHALPSCKEWKREHP